MKPIVLAALIALSIFSCILNSQAQDLARKGYAGFSLEFQNTSPVGARVTRIRPGSPAETAGLRAGDVIKSIDGEPVVSQIFIERKISVIKAGQKMTLTLAEASGGKTLQVVVAPSPKEKNQNKTEYGIINTGTYRLRTITTIPHSSQAKKLPAVLFIQWLSCQSVEYPSKVNSGVDSLLRTFANIPVVFMRVDRPGSGDSEGGPCVDCGLEQELDAYKRALASLKARPDVDPTRIYLLGLSLGGSLAPVVGDGEEIAGYMVSGACTQTWFEHMLDIERRRLHLSGSTPEEVNDAIKKFTKFYERYYVEKMTPGEIARINPELAGLWYDEPEHQYERPAKFYHAVQALNIEGAWQKVKVPVLIVYGEFDWIMSEKDHSRIAEIVNANRPGLATYITMKGLSHSLDRYPTMQDAFNGSNRVFDASATPVFIKWLDEQTKR